MVMTMSVFSNDPISSLPPLQVLPFEAPSPFDDDGRAEVCPPCCWRCMIDVSPLPVTAKYCPRCGVGLLDGAGRTLPIPTAAAAAAMCPGSSIHAYTEEGRRRIA